MAYGSMITENGAKGRVTRVQELGSGSPTPLATAILIANSPTLQQINASVDTALLDTALPVQNLPNNGKGSLTNNGKGGFERGQ